MTARKDEMAFFGGFQFLIGDHVGKLTQGTQQSHHHHLLQRQIARTYARR